ncbi:hypothetical protein [Vibrio gallaecicus]|uniref:Uncharacterized protein n=1 Tax=Vibrio gallaecicus TaxID=552386 RepID=A0ABV4NBH9_9VIBR
MKQLSSNLYVHSQSLIKCIEKSKSYCEYQSLLDFQDLSAFSIQRDCYDLLLRKYSQTPMARPSSPQRSMQSTETKASDCKCNKPSCITCSIRNAKERNIQSRQYSQHDYEYIAPVQGRGAYTSGELHDTGEHASDFSAEMGNDGDDLF